MSGSPSPLPPPSVLLKRKVIGRDEDLAAIRSSLTSPAAGGAVVVTGDPGIGKSALLDIVAQESREDGHSVVRVTGVQFEADVGYSGLNQVVLPLASHLEALNQAHRDALSVATGMSAGRAPERLLVSTAAFLLLRRAAMRAPVLLVADDIQWLDRATAGALGFVARRLGGSGIRFLAAARPDSDGYFERSGLPEYRLRPLSDDSAHRLLRVLHPRLAVTVRHRVVQAASGNPLALAELPEALSAKQRRTAVDLPAVLPLGERLNALFAERIAGLSPACRRLLLMAALDGTGDLAPVEKSGGPSFADDLAAAERARVIVVDLAANRLAFSHPLLAATVVENATSRERREAHLSLAAVLSPHPERRAWHLAEASAAPDEAVARTLEVAAQRILARGDAAGAVSALSRAARLSPAARDKSRRLAEAAYVGADAGGALVSASVFLASAREADPELHHSLPAATAAAHLLLNDDGSVETAHGLVADAVEAHFGAAEPKDCFVLNEALHTLFLLSWYGGRPELWTPLTRAVDELGDDICELLWLVSRTFGDPARTGASAVERLEKALRAATDETDPTRVIRLGTAAAFADRQEEMREALWRVVRQGRRGESPARRHITALFHLCIGDLCAGRWGEVDVLADEGLEICEDQGYRFFGWYFRYVQALLAALRGESEANRVLTDQIRRWAAPRGARGAALFAAQARALAALGSGDAEEAFRQSCLISPPGELAPFTPIALWNALDLVESAIRTGRTEQARRHAEAVVDSDMAALSPRLRVNVLVIQAMTEADAERSDRYFEAALSGPTGPNGPTGPTAHRWPFETARAELLYGESLRRGRRIGEARTHLSSALAAFQGLGAARWADRAAAELRAAGGSPGRRGEAALTVQELEIARLAASGLTNKQIGQRLFLSHRTVGFHLYQAFPKLGITTRSALRDALSAIGEARES